MQADSTNRDLELKPSAARARLSLPRTKDGFALPQPYYTDPTIFAAEISELFIQRWQFAGLECEVPNPGDYLLFEIGYYSVLIVRQPDRSLKALHNTCRHRGSRICRQSHGSFGRRMICPYHQWSYHLDGALGNARHFESDFPKEEYALKPVACEAEAGYIFVCLADMPPDFKPIREQLRPYLEPHSLSGARVAFESTIIEEANWKLVWENNRECYHCGANHPELCRTFPEAPTLISTNVADLDADLAAHWARCEAAGLPSRFMLSAAGDLRTMRLPLVDGHQSLTMSGLPAVNRNLGAIKERDAGSLLVFLYPTMWNHILPDHAITFQVLPLSPLRTQIKTKWLVQRDAVEGADYSLKELTEVWLATNDQDRRIVEENQRGVNSPSFEPGPYAPRHEAGVRQFIEWYHQNFVELHSGS